MPAAQAQTYGDINYLADQYFSGGNTSSTTESITGGSETAVYQTERYGTFFLRCAGYHRHLSRAVTVCGDLSNLSGQALI